MIRQRTRTLIFASAAIAILCLPGIGARASILRVPENFPTIQAAVDAAQEGDEILLASGTYIGEGNRDIRILGRGLTLRSESGAGQTVLDLDGHQGFEIGAYEEGVHVTMDGLTLQNGFSAGPGGAIESEGGRLELYRCRFIGNSSQDMGGALSSDWRQTTVIQDCEFLNNTAKYRGGAIDLSGYQLTATVRRCLFENNSVWSDESGNPGNGAAINLDGDFDIESCDIHGNVSPRGTAAAVYSVNARGKMADCAFRNNSGRVLYLVSNGPRPFVIERCLIFGNPQADGNPVDLLGPFTVQDCVIAYGAYIGQNSFDGRPGLISNSMDRWHLAEFILRNCLLIGGTAGYSGGGFIHGSEGAAGSLLIENCTISGCQSLTQSGGAMWLILGSEMQATIRDSIIYGNRPDAIFLEGEGQLTVTHCDIEGGWPGEGNISADPLWAEDSWGPWYLSMIAAGQERRSPCVDAGSVLASERCYETAEGQVCLNERTTRTDGERDIGAVDMGFHFWEGTPVPVPRPTEGPALGVQIRASADWARPGDTFWIEGLLNNPCALTLEAIPVMFVLEAGGELFFWPSWRRWDGSGESLDGRTADMAPGSTVVQVLPAMRWPDTGGAGMENLRLYGLLLNPDLLKFPYTEDEEPPLGAMDIFIFGYGP